MRAHGRSGCSGPRGIGEYSGWCSPWTKESAYFAAPAARAHQTVRFGLLWITVEMWIRCEHFFAGTGADSALGEEELEDPARQIRAARDESGEVTDGGRALAEELAGFFRRVHAAGSDDLESPAEPRARAAQGLERCGEELGPGKSAGTLREPPLLHTPRVAVVDDADPRLERRRDDLGLVRVGEVGRELHDERLVRGGPHRPEQRHELPRLPAPLVDQPRVRRRDVELDQVTQRAEPRDEPDVVIHGLAGHAHDERHAVRQSDDGGAETLEPRVLEPVAVDEPRTRRAPNAHQVWLRMAWTRLHRDGLGGDGSEPEAHHAPEDPRIVVHRRQDQRVGQPRATERDGEPRVVEAEGGEPIPWQEAQRRLAERDRGGLGEAAEDAVVEEAVEGADRWVHPAGPVEDSTGSLTMWDSAIYGKALTSNKVVKVRLAVLLGVALVTVACATGPLLGLPPEGGADARGAAPEFLFSRDTFAFANLIRVRHPDGDDLYANYCFVLARGLRQFKQFARFDPALPRLDHAGYVALVRRVAARPPWQPALPEDERIVIPGYASLRKFSQAEEAAAKEGLGSRLWTLVHWGNWRVTFWVTPAHQDNVAREIVSELRAGRLVQLLVTNWPKPELNHTVVAFASSDSSTTIDFAVWDPNDPDAPGVVTFDRQARRFWATRLYDTEPGVIRAFRMYYSRLL